MNDKQQKLLDEDMFAADKVKDFSKIGVNQRTVSTQCDETSFELSETLVNDGSMFERRRSASSEGQFNPNKRNGREHSANVPLKLITSTPKIADSIDPNNNTNSRSSENEKSKSGEIITTHPFHKVTCSGCGVFHWCPHQMLMDLLNQMVKQDTGTTQTSSPRGPRESSKMFTSTSDTSPTKSFDTPDTASRKSYQMVERSTGTTQAPSPRGPRKSSNVFRSTSHIAPSSTISYHTPDTASSKSLDSRKRDTSRANSPRKKRKSSEVSSVIDPRIEPSVGNGKIEQVTSQPSAHTTIGRVFDNGDSDQEVPQHFGFNDSSTDEENETFNWSINKTPEKSLDKSLTFKNEPDDTVATKPSDGGCNGTCVHLPSDTSAGTRKTVNRSRSVRINNKQPQPRFGIDPQSVPLKDIRNVSYRFRTENLSKIQTGETSVAIDATIQPKKTRGKINKRKKKSATAQRRSSRNKAKNNMGVRM